jgi:hypothetical protein
MILPDLGTASLTKKHPMWHYIESVHNVDIMDRQPRLFQNFSFWNSFLGFRGKTGLLPVFPRACFKTNRVLKQAQP